MPEPVQHLRVDADKSSSSANTPVASYMPSGAHDTSLPMGKYYPSNYEQRHATPTSQTSSMMPPPTGPVSSSPSSSVKSDSTVQIRLGESIPRTDTKQRLQQYQRDMIAQARLAANQVLGDSPKVTSAVPTATVSLNGVPIQSLQQFGMTSILKPTSPRLLPLGSPGPVTPMDLEGGEGGYLDRGHAPVILGDSEDIARALRAEVAFLRGPSSPAIEAGPQAFL
ncbi:hypothetical protein F5X68DRAFT_75998 [Plectosphaerella plurivora]|uniref:Uncharacterized protein n=1 Tax=Plectosphaerella plurivora TaxID=936078 RepID=A0A9P8VEZ3_9PEZI|nr:hypothetical protein F5X68DRAFT_75998 [Plectosphaerella plurivora]